MARPSRTLLPKQISTYLDGSRMSAYTWWREYQIIRSFFQFWLSRNKLSRLPMPRPQAALPPPFRPYIFSKVELIRLLLAIERTPQFDPMTIRTLLLFIYGTGTRVYEAINLRVSDINFPNKLVSLRRPDGGQRRALPIGRTLRNALDLYVQSSAAQKRGTDLVFVTRDGRPLRPHWCACAPGRGFVRSTATVPRLEYTARDTPSRYMFWRLGCDKGRTCDKCCLFSQATWATLS